MKTPRKEEAGGGLDVCIYTYDQDDDDDDGGGGGGSDDDHARSPADPNTSSGGQKAEIGILLVFTLITRPDSFAFLVQHSGKKMSFVHLVPLAFGSRAGQSSRSVSFKEHQMLAALKLFVFGQACKMTTE
ncbi:Adenosylcobinamide-GDP ribazoletransferase [Trichinella pseudospiralis]